MHWVSPSFSLPSISGGSTMLCFAKSDPSYMWSLVGWGLGIMGHLKLSQIPWIHKRCLHVWFQHNNNTAELVDVDEMFQLGNGTENVCTVCKAEYTALKDQYKKMSGANKAELICADITSAVSMTKTFSFWWATEFCLKGVFLQACEAQSTGAVQLVFVTDNWLTERLTCDGDDWQRETKKGGATTQPSTFALPLSDW